MKTLLQKGRALDITINDFLFSCMECCIPKKYRRKKKNMINKDKYFIENKLNAWYKDTHF